MCVQVIVPKRTALLLDRIMAALQKAVEDDKGGPNFAPDLAENKVRSYVTCMSRHVSRYCHARPFGLCPVSKDIRRT